MKTIFLLIIILATSCTSPKNKVNSNTTHPYVINIEEGIDNLREVGVSHLGANLHYIQLETNRSCLLRKIDQIDIVDSFIFVSDFSMLYMFDLNGNFLRQIGRNGKGPGEYIYVMGFCIDKYRKRIYIRDYEPKIEIFNFKGLFIKAIDNNLSSDFSLTDSMHLAFKMDNSATNNEYSIIVTDLEGTISKKIKNNNRQKSLGSSKFSPIYFYQNSLRFKDIMADTLFSFQKSHLEPIAVFDLGNLKKYDFDLTEKELRLNRNPEKNEQINNMYSIIGISEDPDFLFIKVGKGLNLDKFKFIVFKKQTGEIFTLGEGGFNNDIDGGIPFWPEYISDDNLYCTYIDASDFREQILNKSHELKQEFKQKYSSLVKLAESVKDEVNPIIITINR